MPRVVILRSAEQPFPDPETALHYPNGLLAAGGDLSPDRLLAAYRRGIFPWYEHPQPILWWSPDPRMVLFPNEIHISRSLRKRLRHTDFRITADTSFEAVIDACAAPRDYTSDTWIGGDMRDAYVQLHRLGHAHSIEVWLDNELIGGLYGVGIGAVFFGESMFSRTRDASKIALVHLEGQLRQWDYALIDCQQDTPHMRSMGGRTIARTEFLAILGKECERERPIGTWSINWKYTN